MKKFLSFMIVTLSVFALVGCGEDELGVFPEVRERDLVELSDTEIQTILSDATTDLDAEQAMLYSVDFDFDFETVTNQYFSGTLTESVSASLLSKTYATYADQISDVKVHSENDVTLNVAIDYSDSDDEDESYAIDGSLDAYFVDQYVYANIDLNGVSTLLEDLFGSEIVTNGKYKLNVGITQEMWDEFYISPTDYEDQFSSVPFPVDMPFTVEEAIAFMQDIEMLEVYESKDSYTFVLSFDKANIIAHSDDLADFANDGTITYTDADYTEFKVNLEAELDDFDILDVSVALVIQDNQLKTYGIDANVQYNDGFYNVDFSGQIILDMNVEMPEFPSDLDEYELFDANSFLMVDMIPKWDI